MKNKRVVKYFITNLFIFSFLSLFAQQTETVYGSDLFELEVDVVHREKQNLINNVTVYLFEMPGGKFIEQKSTNNGTVRFMIDPYKNYELRTCHSNYLENGLSIYENYDDNDQLAFCVSGAELYGFTTNNPQTSQAKLYAKLPLDEIVVGKTFNLENIYFDLDQSYLRAEAKRELNYLVGVMKRFKTLKIEMGSHTDSRGASEYNASLSERRAKSTYDYLIQKGISEDRMTYKGYGETQLVNECADGVKCSAAEHQQNRRTEFKITEFSGTECTTIPTVTKNFHCCD